MKTYEVVIRATVTKTLTVQALDEAEAEEVAYAEFTTDCTGQDESYSENILNIEEKP